MFYKLNFLAAIVQVLLELVAVVEWRDHVRGLVDLLECWLDSLELLVDESLETFL